MHPRCAKSLALPVFAAMLACLVVPSAQAGHVEAIAASASDIQDGPTAFSASAVDAGFSANTTRTAGLTTTNISGQFFTALRVPVRAVSWSEFTVEGLASLTPLTFVWDFTASRSWNPDNASVGTGMTVGLTAPGFIDYVRWGISYVDGPVPLGDFAGTLTAGFAVAAAGGGFSNVLPLGDWDGQGTRTVAITMDSALTGTTGSFSLDLDGAMVGDVTALHSLALVGLTVPAGTALANGGAWLLLDNGSRLAITVAAVPEAQSWALLLAGLAGLVFASPRLQRRVVSAGGSARVPGAP